MKNLASAPIWIKEMSSEKRAAMVSSALQIFETASSPSTEYKQTIAINFGISRGCVEELFSWLAPHSVAASKCMSQMNAAAVSTVPAPRHTSASDGTVMSNSETSPRQMDAPAVNASVSTPQSAAYLRPDIEQKTERDRAHVVQFLKNATCYAIMPDSGKVVVLDTRVPTRLAFFALVEHGVTAASIFDELRNCHVGMLTSTDLIRILLHGYAHTALSKVFTMTIREWFATAASHKAKNAGTSEEVPTANGVQTSSLPPLPELNQKAAPKPELISINADESLMSAIAILTRHDINWLPVVDQKTTPASVLHVLTHSRVLSHLVNGCTVERRQMDVFFQRSIAELGIGTFGGTNIITATTQTSLVEVMTQLVAPGKSVSGIPILDAEGRVKDIYYRVDAFYLTRIKNLREAHLKTAVGTVLAAQANASVRNGLHTCYKTDSLQSVVAKFGKTRTHTLVCVKSDGTCDGVVTVKDLFRFLLALDSNT